MKASVMQPYLFPYLGYYHMVAKCDLFVFYDDVQYIQRGYINRNQILINGEKKYFTVPVKKHTLGQVINQVEMLDFKKWATTFLRQLQNVYSKAPYYKQTIEIIERILFEVKSDSISLFASNSIMEIAKLLNLDVEFKFSSNLDYEKELSKEMKLESLLKSIAVDEIILPTGSKELYKDWGPLGVTKTTMEPLTFEYSHFNNQKCTNMSIIDVLMFNSINVVKSVLN